MQCRPITEHSAEPLLERIVQRLCDCAVGSNAGCGGATIGCHRRDSRCLANGVVLAALLALMSASGCAQRDGLYGVVQDAGLSADGKTLLVLVEHGTQTTATSSNLWRGDITTQRPESVQIHEFDRSSGKPGRVLSFPAPARTGPRGYERLQDYAPQAGAPAASLQDCHQPYDECVEAATPHPYLLGRQVVDPQQGRTIEWDGQRLVVAPFKAMTAVQIRAARETLFRRSVERMRAAATKDLAERATAEDPDRIVTGDKGTVERDPGMTATYNLRPGRVVTARFEYANTRFNVVWARDGACITDHALVAPVIGCDAGDSGALQRAASGIARARPPDPDRMGTSWGVVATTDAKETPAGSTTVACHGMPRETAGKPCNDPKGTTACRASLPVLCSKADGSHPPQSPWARRLALTAPVRGTELLSVAVADQVCRSQLGDGWKMTDAEESTFKYQVTGVGSLPPTTRFWVRNGGGLANCW